MISVNVLLAAQMSEVKFTTDYENKTDSNGFVMGESRYRYGDWGA